MNDSFPALETIFNAAKALPPESRTGYLDLACKENPALREQVERLLDAAEHTDGFLDARPVGLTLPENTVVDSAVREGPGTKIGRYKLLQQIGEGGMGVVYMAEQEEPVRRRVALKIIKLGMDTQQVVARFEAERQALALMDHPNIARVLDGGTTDSGRPYFVMELVQGVPIVEFCDKARLPAQERIDLFLQVCGAVQSAHQKGIIHRDLKPSNILVTQHHGKPMPKVIDFGIAKAMNQKLTEKTLFTQHATMIGTPAYMSPEQAEMSSMDVDTRSDIYSLGVLLYELLTGSTPFPEKRLRSLGYGEMQRVIAEEEPERPSARLSTLGQEQKTVVAKNRGEDLAALNTRLRGDLDWIVMKCLEKDRSRRYETANGLAADLKRHLDNEPVVARPPSAAYRLQKAFRRNKLLFAAGAVVGLALVLGVSVSTWQAIVASRARQQEARANEQLRAQVGETEQARQAAEKAAVAESQQRVRAEELLQDIQFQKADDLLANGSSVPGITLLGQMLRAHPSNAVIASRFASALLVARLPQLTEPLRHEGLVNPAEFSPDGQRVVTASADKTARVWDARTGQAITGPIRHEDKVHSARFSPDGQWVVTASADKTARVWDARTGQALIEPLRHQDIVVSARFSPDGQRILTASADHSARLWDARSGQAVADPLRHEDAVGVAEFSPDGQRIVTAAGNTVRIWEARSGQAITEPLRHENPVLRAGFSADGQRLVTAAGNTVRIWDARSGQAITEPLHHGARVLSARFSPEGNRIVTSSAITARVWDARTGQALTGPLRHEASVQSVQFSPDGKRVVTASFDRTAQVWDAFSGQPVSGPFRHDGMVLSAEFSPDGQHLVTASDDGSARVWDLRPDLPLTGVLRHEGLMRQARFSPDGQRVVTGSLDKTARVWDARSGQPLTEPLRHGRAVGAVQFSPDGLEVVTLSQENGASTAQRWDARSGQPLAEPVTLGQQMSDSALSPDGQRVVTVSRFNRTVRVWDARSGQPLTEPLRQEAEVGTAAFSPDGQRVLTKSRDRMARVWDVNSGQMLAGPLPHDLQVWSDPFSPDGQWVVTASGKTARVWDVRTGQPLTEPLRHEDDLKSAEFSPDGRRLVTASGNAVRVWDARSGRALTESIRHETQVNAARFSPDGRRLVTASGDTVRVWDAQSLQPLTEAFRHDDKVLGVEFSPDGTRVVSTSFDRSARVWEVPTVPVPAPSWFLDWAEARVGRRFDPSSTAGAVLLTEVRRQQELVAARTEADFYTRIAQWCQADPATRPLSPHTTWTAADYLRVRIDENTLVSLREAVRIAPTNALAWARLALVELDQDAAQNPGRWIEAEFSARQALRWDPLNSEAWYARATVELGTGQTNQAMVSLERSLQLDPANGGAWGLKGRLLTHSGRPGEALAAYRNVLTALPAEPVAAFQTCMELLQKQLDVLASSGRSQEPGAREQEVVRWMVEEVLIRSRRLPVTGLETLVTPLEPLAFSFRRAGFAAEGDRLNAGRDEGFRRLAIAQPGDLWPALRMAALDVWLGREREYAATCASILETVRNTKDPNQAERAAKLASLVPTDDPTREAALVLARRAVELGKGQARFGLMQLALGMAEYRSDHWLEAEQMLLAAPTSGDFQPNSNVIIPAGFFRAMALFHQGKQAEARQLLAETSAAMKPLPKDPKNPLASAGDDGVLIHWLAHREATALIGAEATRTASAKP